MYFSKALVEAVYDGDGGWIAHGDMVGPDSHERSILPMETDLRRVVVAFPDAV